MIDHLQNRNTIWLVWKREKIFKPNKKTEVIFLLQKGSTDQIEFFRNA